MGMNDENPSFGIEGILISHKNRYQVGVCGDGESDQPWKTVFRDFSQDWSGEENHKCLTA